MSKGLVAELVDSFADLPQGRSARNKYQFTEQHVQAILQLRELYTPTQIQDLIDVSVYKIIKLSLWARHLNNLEKRKDDS